MRVSPIKRKLLNLLQKAPLGSNSSSSGDPVKWFNVIKSSFIIMMMSEHIEHINGIPGEFRSSPIFPNQIAATLPRPSNSCSSAGCPGPVQQCPDNNDKRHRSCPGRPTVRLLPIMRTQSNQNKLLHKKNYKKIIRRDTNPNVNYLPSI